MPKTTVIPASQHALNFRLYRVRPRTERSWRRKSGTRLGVDQFFEKSLKRMQGAVQIPTESFDDMGKVNEDPRWDIFIEFHDYLKKTFPLV